MNSKNIFPVVLTLLPIIMILSVVLYIAFSFFNITTIFRNIPNFIVFSFLSSLFCFLMIFVSIEYYISEKTDFLLRISDLIWIIFAAAGVIGGAYSLHIKDLKEKVRLYEKELNVSMPMSADVDAACGQIMKINKSDLSSSGNSIHVYCNEIANRKYSTADDMCRNFIDYTDSNDGIRWIINDRDSNVLSGYFYTISNFCHNVQNIGSNNVRLRIARNELDKFNGIFSIDQYFWLFILSFAASLRLTKSIIELLRPFIKNIKI